LDLKYKTTLNRIKNKIKYVIIATLAEQLNVITDIRAQKIIIKAPLNNDTISGFGLMKCNNIWWMWKLSALRGFFPIENL